MLMTLDSRFALFLSGLAAVLPIPFSPCSVVRADRSAENQSSIPVLSPAPVRPIPIPIMKCL
jgi:hypothetical protein